MDWKKASVIHTEDANYQSCIREAIKIGRRAPKALNEDKGAYMLSSHGVTLWGG